MAYSANVILLISETKQCKKPFPDVDIIIAMFQ